MATWTRDELEKIGAADELQIASVRRDGTLTNPVTIWVVRLGDDLYVRSYKGPNGTWFRAAQTRHEGRIHAGGVEKDVTFTNETNPAVNDQIDSAYQTKYGHYAAQYVQPMVGREARATTIKLLAR
jgi:hypothetical protein